MMEFPAYVPAAVRKTSERERELINSFLLNYADNQNPGACKAKRDFTDQLKCWHRLTQHEEMGKVYELLTGEFTSDRQWVRFIKWAVWARKDYADLREQAKHAKHLSAHIAKLADELADAVHQFQYHYFCSPEAVRSLPVLLRAARSEDNDAWVRERHHILGGEATPSNSPVLALTGQEDQEHPDRVLHQKAILQAWGVAPKLPSLLDALAEEMRRLDPSKRGVPGAAIATRQQNPKTEYLRAFAYALTAVHVIELTPKIMQAMAIVATVVFNDPDIVVTYDDVRQALKPRPG